MQRVTVTAAVLFACATLPSSFIDASDGNEEPALERTPAQPARLASRALLLDAARAGERIVAVGEHGIIIHSDDAGRTWNQASAPVQSLLTGVSFSDDTHGWAAGHEATVLRTNDSGTSWTLATVSLAAEDSLLDVITLPSGRALLAGAYGVFLETDDDGLTWNPLAPVEEDMHINRISRGTSGVLHLAGEAGMLAVSESEGRVWTPLASPYEGSFYGLHELASGRLLAHGLRGHVYVSDDRGESWLQRSVEREVLLMAAAEPVPGMVVVAGLGGVVFVSNDNADTFHTAGLSRLKACSELLPVSDREVLAIGEGGVEMIDLGRLSASP